MKNRKPILILSIVLILLFQQMLNAQTKQQFLSRVGIVDSLYSNTLNEYREIYIQLPESYKPNSNQKYPTAYILDGENLLPIANNVQNFYSGGFMPEMILVGISNAKNRTRDLTTSSIKKMNDSPFNQENGKADNFLKFIKKELIPYVESKYPVTNYRTLIGHSYGGLFTIYTLINKPELFANYLAIDPSLDWDNQKLLKQAKAVLQTKDYKGKSLYISLSGQLDRQNSKVTINNVMQDTSKFTLFSRSNIMFSNLVKQNKQNGLFYKWQFYPNELHGTIPLPSIKDGLLTLFDWFQMKNTDKINDPATSIEKLLSIIKYREKKLLNHFGYQVPPYPEFLLNMSGYMNLDMQQPKKSKMYFEQAIKYYPKSANAYDSMADYYERQNDFVNALKSITKAYKLNSSNYYKKRIEKLKTKKN